MLGTPSSEDGKEENKCVGMEILNARSLASDPKALQEALKEQASPLLVPVSWI
jgi:hypothetical protein